MDYITINGRKRYFIHVQSVGRTERPGEFLVYSDRRDAPFRVEGGKKAGGTRRDWFLEGPGINGAINCTSLMDALNLIESGAL